MAIMTIIIKTVNKASEVAQKVGNDLQCMSSKVTEAMDKVRQAGDSFTDAVVKNRLKRNVHLCTVKHRPT